MKGILRSGIVLAGLLAAVSWAGPREDVNASIDKFLAARSFHADMRTSGPKPMAHQLDFVAPGRYRMRMPGMGDQYIIGDTMFLSIPGRSGPGRTLRVPMPKGTLSQWRDPARLAENAAGMSVSALGEDMVGSARATKYRVVHSKPQPSTMTLWVGRDGYPLQILTSGNAQGQRMITTIRYSRFNDPTIRVDAPK